jgi:HK97 family phage prohead protease
VVIEQEIRALVVADVRVHRNADKPPVMIGYASVFNSDSENLGGFIERVAPEAFDWTLKQKPDVRALIDHDSSLVLGRTKAGTLRLSVDNKGLKAEIDPPDTSYARDLMVSMERGDVSQMSFGFRVLEDSWDDLDKEVARRILRKLDLDGGDVSIVTYPAYRATKVSVRALETLKAAVCPNIVKPDPEQVRKQFLEETRERIAAFRRK